MNYQFLFESLPDLYLVLRPDFTIEAVSDEYLKATMTRRQEIVGRYLFDVFPDNPDDRTADGVSKLRSSLNHVLQFKTVHIMSVQRYDVRRPDGVFETKYWSPRNTPILDDQQAVAYIIHQVKDVTHERLSEQRLRDSETNYALLVDSISDYAIFMLDTDGRVLSWNKAAEQIKGYRSDEIIGRSIEVFYTAEDLQNGAPAKNLAMAKNYGHYESEGWRVRKDGSLFYANIIFNSLVGEDQEVYGYSKVTRDVTEKKKAEEDLRVLAGIANNIQDIIITSDNQYRITGWNDAAEKILEWKSEEVLGRTASSFLNIVYPEESRADIILAFEKFGYWKGEVIYHTKSGRPVHVLSTASFMRNTQSEVTGNLVLARDITERKKGEIALKEREEQIQTIFRNAPDAVIVIDDRGIILRWNPRAEEIFGWRSEEVDGKFLHDTIIPAFFRERHIRGMEHFLHTGEGPILNKAIELPALRKDGSTFEAGISISPSTLHGKQVFIGFISDITERKQAERALNRLNEELEQRVLQRTVEIEQREKRFRALIENSHDVILLMNENFDVVYRSQSAQKITGWDDAEILNHSGIDNIHPADEVRVKRLVKDLLKYPGQIFNIVFRSKHKHGHYLWLEGTFINRLQDADVQAVVFNFRDITQQKELQDLLHRANSLARIGGWEIDLRKKTVYWSDITREIHETDLTYMPTLESGLDFYKAGADRELIVRKVNEAIVHGKPWDEELQIITAKNNERWIRTIGESEFLEGMCIRVYGSFQDIDQRKRAQLEVQRLNEELEEKVISRTQQLRESIEELESFSYSISHDLRAPLRGIIGYSEILKEEFGSDLNDEAKRMIQRISSNTIKMAQLVDDLLHFSRLARQDIFKRSIDTNAMVREIAEGMSAVAPLNKVRWSISKLPNALGDFNAIRQVWINLLSNAVKYSSKKSDPHVAIGSYIDESQIVFYVEDNGAGFDMRYKDKLFKVFQRLHKPNEFEGTGVGLAIVERIIGKHGGKVWAESQVDQGSRFYFSLPD